MVKFRVIFLTPFSGVLCLSVNVALIQGFERKLAQLNHMVAKICTSLSDLNMAVAFDSQCIIW